MDMKTLRLKLEKLSKPISEDALFMDILGKLPVFEDREKGGPYDAIEQEQIKAIEVDEARSHGDEERSRFTLLELEHQMTAKFLLLYPQHGHGEEVGLMAGQVKKKCFKCGSWNHMSYNCTVQRAIWDDPQAQQRANTFAPRGQGRGGRQGYANRRGGG